jgi:hypothetical protein
VRGIGWAFFVSGETRSTSTKKGGITLSNQNNGNQFREDEIVILQDKNEKIGKEHKPSPAF